MLQLTGGYGRALRAPLRDRPQVSYGVRQKRRQFVESDYIISVQHGPVPPDPDDASRHALAAATADLLRNAGFITGLGEPLIEMGYSLALLTESGGQLADVVQHLQAFAAPAGAYIPPAEQFAPLAAAIITLHKESRDASDPAA